MTASSDGNVAAWVLEPAFDGAAILWRGGGISYAELRGRVRRAARRVAEILGDDSRRIVPILGPNSLEWIVSYLGVLYAGAVPALVPPTTPANLRGVFTEVDARLAFVDPAQHAALTGLSATILPLGDEAATELAAPVELQPGATALVLYTSGSTGRPKGVMLSAANLRANAEAILRCCPLTPADRAFVTLPFFYCYGLSVLHTHLRVGASVYLCRSELPEAIVDDLVDSDATGIPTVPSLLQALAVRSTLTTRAPARLRYLMVSGGRLADGAAERLTAALPRAILHVRYGVTELTAAASFLPPALLASKRGSIGRGVPGSELTVERAPGEPVTAGSDEVGELVVRGDHVAQGYFRDEALTRERFRDGAFLTGDLARVDAEGFIYLVGRRADFLKTIGHRVAPAEVEEVLLRAPGVLEAAVFGVAHPLRGEALTAAVVLAPDATATVATLLRHCAAELPSFKVPAKLHIVAELPRTPNRKIDRVRLAALVSEA